MNYQNSIINKYKKAFPGRTLKVISQETGIQMTRVFRLFNGAEMKLKEYEAFEASLRKGSLSDSTFSLMEKFQKFIDTASDTELSLLEIEFNHMLKIENFLNHCATNKTYQPAPAPAS
ncbi:MAG: hypothetical protein WEB87_02765 [Bacteriovoracaceae bacterium]